jgi:hypothetical protein
MKKSPWIHVLIGIACLTIPLLGIGWWIYVAQTNPGEHADLVQQFLSPFPGFLQNAQLLTWIQLAFCGAAFFFAYTGLDAKGASKYVSIVLLGLSGLLGFWLLFSLM